MASINQLISEMAHALGQPNNHVTRETLRSAIYHERNEKIRRSYENHKYIDKILLQRYRVEIKDVMDGDIFASLVGVGNLIKRTTQKVPRPVRLTNNLPFQSVRTVGFENKSIAFVREANAQHYKALEIGCNMPTYDYINGYIYINMGNNINFKGLGSIIIESPFELPQLIPTETQEGMDMMDDDDQFMLPEDMIGIIKETIFKRNLFNIPRETNEIPVKDGYKQDIDV
jgi:hypothetical protein